ncbi:hypothetical protein [Variovorax sp. J31P207]|uniref:hypothetical protein n=1 Tax=Variovorax sp. J31P207 TaxID=3053510 RepID=UPI00257576F8|nr:hypothetical protein [Variovorax sp. J31P207]MDM0069627.1 hypothetical protein [Variovorax sp. J31P207]
MTTTQKAKAAQESTGSPEAAARKAERSTQDDASATERPDDVRLVEISADSMNFDSQKSDVVMRTD